MATAIWSPAWYGEDQPIAAGREDCLWFTIDSTDPLRFATGGTRERDYPMRARVDRMCHATLGEIRDIEFKWGTYVFHLAAGESIHVDAEQTPGSVEGIHEHVEDWRVWVNLTPLADEIADTLAKAARKVPLLHEDIAIIVGTLLHKDPWLRNAASRALTALGAEALPEVVEALRLPGEELRYELLRFLTALGRAARPALPLLLDLARTESGRISFRTAQAAHAAGCPQADVLKAFSLKSEEDQAKVRTYLSRP